MCYISTCAHVLTVATSIIMFLCASACSNIGDPGDPGDPVCTLSLFKFHSTILMIASPRV